MDGVPHILDYAGGGWVGVAAMLLLLGFLLALGKSGAHYLHKISDRDTPRHRTVNYREVQQDEKSAILLTVASLAGIALCAYILSVRFSLLAPSPLHLLIVAAAVLLFFAFKYLLILLLDKVFYLGFSGFRIFFFLIYSSLGFCCIILSLFAARTPFQNVALLSLALILLISLIAEFFLLVKNFSANLISVFYIFLYLCTSEILPIAVGLRVISNVLN